MTAPYLSGIAQVAELVDALVSGTSAARRGGSSPLLGTTGYWQAEQRAWQPLFCETGCLAHHREFAPGAGISLHSPTAVIWTPSFRPLPRLGMRSALEALPHGSRLDPVWSRPATGLSYSEGRMRPKSPRRSP